MGILGWVKGFFRKTSARGEHGAIHAENILWEDVSDVFSGFYRAISARLRASWGDKLASKILLSSLKGQISDFMSETQISNEKLFDRISSVDNDSKSRFLAKVFSEFLESLHSNAADFFGENAANNIFIKTYMEEYGSFLSADGKTAFSMMPKKTLGEISALAAREMKENVSAIIFSVSLIKDRETRGKAQKIADRITRSNFPDIDEDDFVSALLGIEKLAVSTEGSPRELRESVAKTIKTESLGPRMRFLMSSGWGERVLPFEEMFSSMARELFSVGIERESAERFIKDLTKGSLLEGMGIKRRGAVFETINQKFITLPEGWSFRVSDDAIRMIRETFAYVQNLWGKKIADDIISKSYKITKERYSHCSDLKPLLKSLPKGVLEEEKIELMDKVELESLGKEFAREEAMKEEFINIMAHELKTPLIPIIGYLSMIIEDSESSMPEEVREKLKVCLDAAFREQDMVNDLLDITKLEAGTMKYDKHTIDAKQLLEGALAGFELKAKQKGLEFISIVGELGKIEGDERRLTQVINNFLTNAIKFTDYGSVRVEAVTNGSNIEIKVIDTGKGIRKESMGKLFTKFFQESGDKKYIGTGLGLAICKEIIQAHGGKIWAESEFGKGSSFGFSIPIKK